MKVALTVNDFLRRAAEVYGDRIGFVDEADQPAAELGISAPTREMAASRPRRRRPDSTRSASPQGERVAIVSHNSARLLTVVLRCQRIGPDPRARSTSGSSPRRSSTSSITPALACCSSIPSSPDALASVKCERTYDRSAPRPTTSCSAYDAEPKPWTPDEDATATINYTSGTTARPKGVQLTHRNIWVNATTFGWHIGVNDRDVYLHTLPQFHCNGWGMTYAVTGMGGQHIILRKVDGAEILRRVERPRRHVDVRRTRRRGDGARRRPELGRRDPRPRPRARGRRRRAAADADDRARSRPSSAGSSSRSTDSPRPRRCSRSTATAPSSTTCRPASGRSALSRAGGTGDRHRSKASRPTARCSPAATSSWTATGSSRKRRPTPSSRHRRRRSGVVPHRRRRLVDDADHYLTISDRKKDVIISGGENVSSIEVEDAIFSHPEIDEVAVIGVPDEKWGELVMALVVATPRFDAHRGRRHRLHQDQARRIQVPQADRVPRQPGPHRHRQAAEVQAARAVLARSDPRRQLTAGEDASPSGDSGGNRDADAATSLGAVALDLGGRFERQRLRPRGLLLDVVGDELGGHDPAHLELDAVGVLGVQRLRGDVIGRADQRAPLLQHRRRAAAARRACRPPTPGGTGRRTCGRRPTAPPASRSGTCRGRDRWWNPAPGRTRPGRASRSGCGSRVRSRRTRE